MSNIDRVTNPTLAEISDMIELLKLLEASKDFLPSEIDQYLDNGNEHIETVKALLRFNDLFKDECWILNDQISAKAVEDAVNKYDQNDIDKAQIMLANAINEDALNLFILRADNVEGFRQRKDIFFAAKVDYTEGRFISCIPVLLLCMDGIVNDITKNFGLFSESVDLDAWDSITQHSKALNYIHKKFLTKTRKNTNLEPIYVPYRNGILHGRDVNYGNKLVAAKCWNILFALRTWYQDKKGENYKKKELEDRKISSIKNSIIDDLLNSFQEHSYEISELNYSKDTPEEIASRFFDAWKNKRWGLIVPLMWHSVGKQIGRESRYNKETYENTELLSFSIKKVTRESAIEAVVSCRLKIKKSGNELDYNTNLRMIYANDASELLPEGYPDGTWYIIQNSLIDILFK